MVIDHPNASAGYCTYLPGPQRQTPRFNECVTAAGEAWKMSSCRVPMHCAAPCGRLPPTPPTTERRDVMGLRRCIGCRWRRLPYEALQLEGLRPNPAVREWGSPEIERCAPCRRVWPSAHDRAWRFILSRGRCRCHTFVLRCMPHGRAFDLNDPNPEVSRLWQQVTYRPATNWALACVVDRAADPAKMENSHVGAANLKPPHHARLISGSVFWGCCSWRPWLPDSLYSGRDCR
jgi:hypothetical protein